MTSSPTLTFNDGNTIPQLGYGVWQVEDDVAEKVVRQAFEAGFRHIDTAKIYGNESGVGRAIASSGLSAEEIFITTKLWNADQGYESTLAAFEDSMDRLGLETLDLYLIHWMQPKQDKYVDTWKALIELQKRGRVKSIGVSNFSIEGLQRLIDETGVVPAIHQVELHPFFNQSELRAFDAAQGILTQAWSPLGQGGELLENATIAEIAAKHHATPAQVVIAWHLAIGNVVIPKSVTESRIQENFAALSVKLDEADVEAINGLDRGAEGRIGPDPAVSDFA
ncbi:aldo/keto reductase [Arthrobacter sp. TES]|uniref:Aldo/keto reductase n=1 Tax=Paenarthrobacter ureafaciens TaxID=37931 RepID=A0AAX3EJW0_PAEUR|nr:MULTISPECIES: aldo/keto reductase [Paenarthrobacter]AMB39418.1 oxidoreductase [Arthrobacter sp. ATCC 21022]AOY72674.1 oxidoreductase [Arthrobacter sp. ZXY-2]ERI35759.1 oxidoreductase [Arthrobacter sp. AK-YN10]NKR12460.1 oxidoreductase [Arthrobacter sp. M5]NKR14291.1 oxidoreductase [Arthrobacter sp. M6]OEH61270.1 oxidoreductase [Arthrobacter sp. D2]OEH64299.1 oxidoreductase [Arthrobacter sp. D4]QOI64307.1 aldo/keto reductase [Arthrobacter sp. TES]BCW83057.1 oxidoreductase [Arthrobacter s